MAIKLNVSFDIPKVTRPGNPGFKGRKSIFDFDAMGVGEFRLVFGAYENETVDGKVVPTLVGEAAKAKSAVAAINQKYSVEDPDGKPRKNKLGEEVPTKKKTREYVFRALPADAIAQIAATPDGVAAIKAGLPDATGPEDCVGKCFGVWRVM